MSKDYIRNIRKQQTQSYFTKASHYCYLLTKCINSYILKHVFNALCIYVYPVLGQDFHKNKVF